MKLQPIVDRLKLKGLGRVYGALELAALAKSGVQLPAHFVILDNWTAAANRMSGVYDQKVTEEFGVVTLINGAALREDRISEQLGELQDQLIDALVGWTMPGASRACEAVRGRLLSVSGSTVSWATTFSTASHIRKGPS